MTLAVLWAGLLPLPSARAADPPAVNSYQFSTGFSSTQGQGQWHYLQWTGSAYSPMTWDATNSRWKGSCTYCLIGRGWVHPESTEAVIGWRAPRAGTVTVRGTMDHRQYGTSSDGVRTFIKRQGTQVWPSEAHQTIQPGFMANHVVRVDVAAGDFLYFHVNKIGTSNHDSLRWDPRVDYGYEPPFTLDRAELVMTPADYDRVGIPYAHDSSLSVVPRGAGFDFYHSGDWGTRLSKFHGTLDEPAQSLIYAADKLGVGDHQVNERWWVTNLYETPEGNLLAFCHIENADTATTGWWAIALAYSTDDGQTFQRLGKVVTQTALGSSTSPNIDGIPYVVKDGYFYVYYTESTNQAAVARAPVASVLDAAGRGTVSAWHKYHNGGWTETGHHGQASEIMPDSVWYSTHGDAAYSTYLGKYLMAGPTGRLGDGVYLTFSDDAVHYGVPSWVQSSPVATKNSASPYATIVDLDGSDNGVVGQSFYVYFNHRPKEEATQPEWSTVYRWLYRQKVTLHRAGFDKNSHDASAEFAPWVGKNPGLGGRAWSYAAGSGTGLVPGMAWDGAKVRYNGPAPDTYVDATTMHPDGGYDAVRVWTAPAAGTVEITAPAGIAVDSGTGADGVGVRIRRDSGPVWSAPVGPGESVAFPPLRVTVARGDHLYFSANQNENSAYDAVRWAPVVSYVDGSRITYNAWPDFSGVQGHHRWHYYEYDGAAYTPMTWDAANQRWNGSATYLMLRPQSWHPDGGRDAVRAWVAPKDGTVTITSVMGAITAAAGSGADGVRVKVLRNSTNVWPASGYAVVPPGGGRPFDAVRVAVAAGDTLYFHVNQNGGSGYDSTVWVPAIAYLSP
ncbi:hypothetical protein WEI85_17345 [Actinomycetes bacterium KLBMP 9797]